VINIPFVLLTVLNVMALKVNANNKNGIDYDFIIGFFVIELLIVLSVLNGGFL